MFLLFYQQQLLEQTKKKLQTLMMTDELTGIFNRRGFGLLLKETMGNSPASRIVSFIVIDIDAFKAYNDFYGHVEEDTVIRKAAQTIQREVFLAGGLAGEKFVVVLFDEESQKVWQAAERIRNAVVNLQIKHERSAAFEFVTVNAGVKTGTVQEGEKHLLQVADQAFYQSKQSGRNRVAVL